MMPADDEQVFGFSMSVQTTSETDTHALPALLTSYNPWVARLGVETFRSP